MWVMDWNRTSVSPIALRSRLLSTVVDATDPSSPPTPFHPPSERPLLCGHRMQTATGSVRSNDAQHRAEPMRWLACAGSAPTRCGSCTTTMPVSDEPRPCRARGSTRSPPRASRSRWRTGILAITDEQVPHPIFGADSGDFRAVPDPTTLVEIPIDRAWPGVRPADRRHRAPVGGRPTSGPLRPGLAAPRTRGRRESRLRGRVRRGRRHRSRRPARGHRPDVLGRAARRAMADGGADPGRPRCGRRRRPSDRQGIWARPVRGQPPAGRRARRCRPLPPRTAADPGCGASRARRPRSCRSRTPTCRATACTSTLG